MANLWRTRQTGMFRGAPQGLHFRSMALINPARVVRRSGKPQPLPRGEACQLPPTYNFNGAERPTQALLDESETVGLLVVKNGRVIRESYADAVEASTQWTSWSMAKSIVSALFGIALGDGLIDAIEDDVCRYVPELHGSAYDGVPLAAVLQMSSGARWSENYADPDSEVIRRFRAQNGGSLDDVALHSVRENPPGTWFQYNSTDTHVLGMVLRRASGLSLAEFLRERLWQPMGAEDDAFWNVDSKGMEDAAAGLNATLRDYAKFGELYRCLGASGGRQLVPEAWTIESTRPNARHVHPGAVPGYPFGYGYQWWLPANGLFSAIGVYNQYIHVDRAAKLTIVKLSANRHYGRTYDEAGYRDQEHMALFRTIARTFV
jgi:CubicO group peptidase (beta-lactamase class C family)